MKLVDLRPKKIGADMRGVCQLGALLNQNEPEVDAYITGLATPLSSAQIGRLNTLVASLKSGLGISALSDAFDIIRLYAGETAESSLRNLVKNAHHGTAINSPTFTQFEGFTGNGTSSYIKSNYNPATDANNVSQNNISFGAYSRSNNAANSNELGAVNASLIGISQTIRNASSYTGYRVNGDLISFPSNVTGLGLYSVSRSNAANFDEFINGVNLRTNISASSSIIDLELYVLCRNANGTASNFSNKQLSFMFIAKALSNAQMLALYNAIEAYMDANGKGVIS